MKTFVHIPGPDIPNLEKREVNGIREYKLPSGKYVPSVTTMLGHFKRKQLSEWRSRVGEQKAKEVSTKAASRGTKVHNLLEKYLANEPNVLNESVMPDIKEIFIDFQKTLDRVDNIRYLEACLFSEKMALAGRVDCIGEFDQKLSIIDFKTANKPKKKEWIRDYFLQATAYALMYEDMNQEVIDSIVILIWSDEGGMQVFHENKQDYITELLEKRLLYARENL